MYPEWQQRVFDTEAVRSHPMHGLVVSVIGRSVVPEGQTESILLVCSPGNTKLSN